MSVDIRSYSNQTGHVALYKPWHKLWFVIDIHVRRSFTGIRCDPDKRIRTFRKGVAFTHYVYWCESLMQHNVMEVED